MKKFLLGLATTLILSSTSFAATTDKNTNTGYSVSPVNNNSMSAMMVPETFITILNYSDDVIYVTSPLYFMIPSGDTQAVSRNGYYGDTYLALEDWRHSTIFRGYVCRHEIITVDDDGTSYNRAHC